MGKIKEIIKQHVLYRIAGKINIRQLIRHTNQQLIHVFYHTISDDYLPHINPLYEPKAIADFKNDIDFLLQYFTPVGIEDVLKHTIKERIITEPSVHISFDDGLSEIYTTVAPILSGKGIPVTLFINSAFVDNKALFYRYKAALLIDKINRNKITPGITSSIKDKLESAGIQGKSTQEQLLQVNYHQKSILDEIAPLLETDFTLFLEKKKPYLNTRELKELQNMGFSIGAHSIDHPLYALLDENEQIRQTIESCNYVQEHFEEKHRYFAFPFSDLKVSASFFSSIYPSVDLTFGVSGIKTEYNGRHIHRIDMERPVTDTKNRLNKGYLTGLIKSFR